jgi:hypothetical protein
MFRKLRSLHQLDRGRQADRLANVRHQALMQSLLIGDWLLERDVDRQLILPTWSIDDDLKAP